MPKKIKWIISFFCVGVFLTACDSKRVYDDYKSLPNTWHKDSIVSFKMTAPDTLDSYNLFINVRVNNAYKYNNLFLIAEMNFPHGKTLTDTLEYKMATPDGALLGKGFSDIKESKLWYKGYNESFKFNEVGNFTISLQQAMRQNGEINGVEHLEGVTEVGFRVEKK